MKIIGFIETSLMDWDGHIVSSIYLPGCNFRCPYCHNKNAVLNPESFEEVPWAYIENYIEDNRDFLDGIVVSGGEPTIHSDLPDLLKKLKAMGLKIKLDTNGTNPDMLQMLIHEKLIDYIAMDVKSPLTKKYSDLVGIDLDLDTIKRSIDLIESSGIDYEFRTTVVPILLSENDVLEIISELKGSKKYALQQFRPDYTLDPALSELKPYSSEVILKLADKAQKNIQIVTIRGDVQTSSL